MQRNNGRWSMPALLREMEAIEQVFAHGSRTVRLSALCWLASVVASMPPGEAQDRAEDRLSALIAEASLAPEALRDVLAFRRQGILAATWPTTPSPRGDGTV